MIDKKILEALASVVYVSKQHLAGADISDDDQKIRASGLYDDWVAGVHKVGDIYNANNQTWECYQAYDNAVHPDINPDNSAWFTFNRPLHGKTPETARPWVAPTHSQDIYQNGEYMIWTDGTIMKCVAPNGTNYSPTDYAAHWEKV